VEAVLRGEAIPDQEVIAGIEVPHTVAEWKQSDADRPRAAAVQSRNREQFQLSFAQGLAVVGYSRNEAEDGTFLLGHWNEDWRY
jgi:predicted GNAT superfamily acetyltransferase